MASGEEEKRGKALCLACFRADQLNIGHKGGGEKFLYYKAEDAGGLAPAKDNNTVIRKFIPRTMPYIWLNCSKEKIGV